MSKTGRTCAMIEPFESITSLVNLFDCWEEFKRGKRKQKDVQLFERHLEDEIFTLQEELRSGAYRHAPYHQFQVSDPKQRCISKATVKDRLVHHLVHTATADFFDRGFIYHSLASRKGKGTHLGVKLLRDMIRKSSANGTKPCYALKMDIRRFFDSVNHMILKELIRPRLEDPRLLSLIDLIIDGFRSSKSDLKGIPLGNVTSQLFANIYLHELDAFVKHNLREKHYLRYCDDFIILSNETELLKELIGTIGAFLEERLRLQLHPKKVTIRKLEHGIDFVGYVTLPHHIALRTRTKQRMKSRIRRAHTAYLQGTIEADSLEQSVQSYLGILSHANHYELSQAIVNAYGSRCSK